MAKKLLNLVIHCTATPEGREVTSNEIRAWHLSPPPAGRGWKKVGYSAMFHLDGTMEVLTPFNEDDYVEASEITNGAVGINSISRHIVYAGGIDKVTKKPKDTRTNAQSIAMANFVKQTIAAHPNILVAGHNQFAPKACPSFDVPTWLRIIGVDEKNIHKAPNQSL